MKCLKKNIIIIASVILFFFIFNEIRHCIEYRNVIELVSSQIIELSPIDNKEITCTGLCYDSINHRYIVGTAGKQVPEEEKFSASIIIYDKDFQFLFGINGLADLYPNLRDIQGVSLDADGNIWFCSPGENLVRLISLDGNEINSFSMNNPSGIAFSHSDNTLWVLTNKKLLNCTTNGKILKEIKFKEKGQDQLFIDENNQKIYITVGNNYQKGSYIFVYDIREDKYKSVYFLSDSYAIEGITITSETMYILNDGYYHSAKVPTNQVNIYNLPKELYD